MDDPEGGDVTTHNLRTAVDRESLALSSNDEMAIQFVDVAGTKALIVDNVYRDPDYVRALALSLDYHRRAGAYPGFLGFISISTSPLLDLVNTLMHENMGDYVMFTNFYQEDLTFAVVTAKGSDLTPGQRRPHVDDFCDYAGLVYLNPPDQCSGGTSFWRHRPTGLEIVRGPADAAVMRDAAALGADEPGLPNGYLTESNETWELSQVLSAQYNRLVFYSSYLLHSPLYIEADFGPDLASRRLTQNCYFETWSGRQARMRRRGPGA